MKTNIICRLQVEGLHWWADASKYEPTMVYLESPHRHMFYIEVKKAVFHDDRDVEFIVFKRKVKNILKMCTMMNNMICVILETGLVKC